MSEKKNSKLAIKTINVNLFFLYKKLLIAFPNINDIIIEYTIATILNDRYSNVSWGHVNKKIRQPKNDIIVSIKSNFLDLFTVWCDIRKAICPNAKNNAPFTKSYKIK